MIFYIVVFTHRLLSSLIFVSVGTLMDGMMKNVMVLDTLMKFLNLSVFACKRSEIANTLNVLSNNYLFLCYYSRILRKADPNIPGMRGLSISVHRSCLFSSDPFECKYIISVNINFFFGELNALLIIFMFLRMKERMPFQKLLKWIKKYTNTPSILVGEFNISKSQLESLLNKSSHQWFTKNLTSLDFTWARNGRSSCIHNVLFNSKMKEYINKVSICSTFNDISDHFPLILSCKKDDSEDFRTPIPSRIFKWSQYMCNV